MNSGFLKALSKANRYINIFLENVQVIAIVAAAGLVTLDVLLRAILSKPISGTAEYVGYIMIVASFFGLGACTTDRSHLKVDLIVQKFSKKAQIINDLINAIMVATVGGIMLCAAVNMGWVTFGLKTKGVFSGVYNWPFYMLMGLGYLPVVLGSLINLLSDIFHLKAGDITNEGGSEE